MSSHRQMNNLTSGGLLQHDQWELLGLGAYFTLYQCRTTVSHISRIFNSLRHTFYRRIFITYICFRIYVDIYKCTYGNTVCLNLYA